MSSFAAMFAAGRSRRRWFGVATLLALGGPLLGQTPRISAPAPVKDYSISFFSEAGYHDMQVKGATADVSDPKRIAVTGLILTLFSGDEAQQVETVILSPEALVEPDPQLVSGPSAVRLVRDDLELTGENWQYEHAAKKILIHRKARIVFCAPLVDLLK